MAALDDLGIDRFALYGMNGGNKLGSAIAAGHPDRVRAYIHAGLTHSIVLAHQNRNQVLGAHRSVVRVLETSSLGAFPADWLSRLKELIDAADPDEAAGLAVERLQSMRDRAAFYMATLAYDMESAVRAVSIPMLVLEFVTALEEQSLGRQAESTAAATGAHGSAGDAARGRRGRRTRAPCRRAVRDHRSVRRSLPELGVGRHVFRPLTVDRRTPMTTGLRLSAVGVRTRFDLDVAMPLSIRCQWNGRPKSWPLSV